MNNTAVKGMTRRDELVAELARTLTDTPERVENPPPDPAIDRLREIGTEVWLDTGDIEEGRRLWRRGMTAFTTNNSLANQVAQSGVMDGVVRDAARRIRDIEPGISEGDLVLDLVFVVNCHIGLRLASAFDARVSVELHPAVANDIEKTVQYARRYHAVNPDRFIVKIPLTPEGYCAVARVRQDDIAVNYTLGFSARQNYLAALVSRPDYVNVFLGRLNAVVADNGLGDGKFVGERTALASQAAVREVRATSGSIRTRQIAASMRGGEQMAALAGVDVFTVPPKAVAEFLAYGYRPDELRPRLDERYEVKLGDDTDKASVEVLWAIDDQFRALAQEVSDCCAASMTGDDLRQLDRDHGTKLFSGFTSEEQVAIREKGKIPDVARWAGRASLDDLMTEAALQSFVVDQGKFDDYIRAKIAEA